MAIHGNIFIYIDVVYSNQNKEATSFSRMELRGCPHPMP